MRLNCYIQCKWKMEDIEWQNKINTCTCNINIRVVTKKVIFKTDSTVKITRVHSMQEQKKNISFLKYTVHMRTFLLQNVYYYGHRGSLVGVDLLIECSGMRPSIHGTPRLWRNPY